MSPWNSANILELKVTVRHLGPRQTPKIDTLELVYSPDGVLGACSSRPRLCQVHTPNKCPNHQSDGSSHLHTLLNIDSCSGSASVRRHLPQGMKEDGEEWVTRGERQDRGEGEWVSHTDEGWKDRQSRWEAGSSEVREWLAGREVKVAGWWGWRVEDRLNGAIPSKQSGPEPKKLKELTLLSLLQSLPVLHSPEGRNKYYNPKRW